MKKSTLFTSACIFTCFVGITAANFKLRGQYDNKEVMSFYKKQPIQPFSHIKELEHLDKSISTSLYLTITASDNNAMEYEFYEDLAKLVDFKVANDTLYITPPKAPFPGRPKLKIFCNKLVSIDLNHADADIFNLETDSLIIQTNKMAILDTYLFKSNFVRVNALSMSKVTFNHGVHIDSAILNIYNKSSLGLDNSTIKYKSLYMDDEATLTLSGQSLKEANSKLIQRTYHD